MSPAESYSGGEGFIGRESSLSLFERWAASRISRRLLKHIDAGRPQHLVKGGLFNVIPTQHEPAVYEEVAEAVSGREIEFEVYSRDEEVGVPLFEGPITAGTAIIPTH